MFTVLQAPLKSILCTTFSGKPNQLCLISNTAWSVILTSQLAIYCSSVNVMHLLIKSALYFDELLISHSQLYLLCLPRTLSLAKQSNSAMSSPSQRGHSSWWCALAQVIYSGPAQQAPESRQIRLTMCIRLMTSQVIDSPSHSGTSLSVRSLCTHVRVL